MRFRAAALRELKELARPKAERETGAALTPAPPEWISTNDALTAFLWQSVTRARKPRLGSEEEVRLLRAMDGRRRLDPQVPEEYVGHLVVAAVDKVAVGYAVDPKNLAAIAGRLRWSMDGVDDLHVRAMGTLLAGLEDKTTVDYSCKIDFSRDLVVSSWGELRLAEQAFGCLGRPDWSRRPDFGPVEGCVYFVEKSRNGDYFIQCSCRGLGEVGGG